MPCFWLSSSKTRFDAGGLKGQVIYKLTGDVLMLLQQYAKENGPLRMRENRNTAFSTSGSTATLTSKKVRGDKVGLNT